MMLASVVCGLCEFSKDMQGGCRPEQLFTNRFRNLYMLTIHGGRLMETFVCKKDYSFWLNALEGH